MKRLVTLTLALSFFALPVEGAERAFPTVVTHGDVMEKYQVARAGGEKLKVLLMPGHEPAYGGAVLGDIKERDLMVDVANKIAVELRKDPALEVVVARDHVSWNEELSGFFEEEWDEIQDFVAGKKRIWNRAVRKGDVEVRDFEPAHNTAATDVALRLYGISKWASDEGFDLVLHLHLNDTGAQNHQGFAVYVPDKEFGNAEASWKLGESLAYELNRYSASSTLPIENYGIVEDQSLIALGAYNTADFPSVLIEYAYIYEPKIAHPEARDAVLSDMAYQTVHGVQEYLGTPLLSDKTLSLPYSWTIGGPEKGKSSAEAYALQIALRELGFFPGEGQLLLSCPITGVMDACTINALNAFQRSKGWTPTGAIGPMTKSALQAAGF